MKQVALAIATILLMAAPALAGPKHHKKEQRKGGPFGKYLYTPEEVMRHQQDLALGEKQRESILNAVKRSQAQILDLQWQAQAEREKLDTLLNQPSVNEKAALAQAEKLMAAEAQVKRTHLTLLVQIKNLLTPEQQKKLRPPHEAGPDGDGDSAEH